jgi:hypothetical protein
MKKLLTLALFCLSAATVATAQTAYPTGSTGCVARWDFASTGTISTLHDVSGNNNNGAATALVTAPNFRGFANKAMLFNGTGSNALVNDAPNLSPTNITMLALVKFNGFYSVTYQVSQLLLKGYPYFGGGVYGLSVTDNIFDNNASTFEAANQQLEAQIGTGGSSAASLPTAGNYVNTSSWYLVVCTYNGSDGLYQLSKCNYSIFYITKYNCSNRFKQSTTCNRWHTKSSLPLLVQWYYG